jgi:Xaa-Pro aminopeptidase
MSYERRWNALRREMEKKRSKAFVVSSPHNIRYLCCTHLYTAAPPTFLVFHGDDAPIAITSWLESNRTALECEVGKPRIWGNLPGKKADGKKSSVVLKKVLREMGAKKALADKAVDGVKGVRFKTSAIIEKLRAVKDESELALIRKAARIADMGAKELPGLLSGKTTELEAANALDHFLRSKEGVQGLAFQTIIAAGPHSAYPHHDNASYPVRNTSVICDFGVYVEGYCSDITRTVLNGNVDERLVEAYDGVRAAVLAGTKLVRPQRPIKTVDLECRRVLKERGLDGYFVHSTGHGIGLEVHESPTAGPRSKDIMKKGTVFTIEPGVYIPGLGGIRIENDVLVTSGGAEVLTKAPYTQ